MVIDTSAIVAISRLEPEAQVFAELLASTPGKLMAAPTYLECAIVLAGLAPNVGLKFLSDIVSDTMITVVPFGSKELELALDARARYGRGSGHKAKLNFGDCFAYALARSQNLPLLFKGEDFSATDLRAAWRPA